MGTKNLLGSPRWGFIFVICLGVGFAVAQGPVDSLLAGAVKWREIGPANMGGRIVQIKVDETDRKVWYVAPASGGLWKTVDGGKTFQGLFQYEAVNSVGDVAVSKSNPNILWVGTGENNPRNSTIYGNGIYKSEDGGMTWKHMGLDATRHIGRIAIHPTNPNIVYVGAMGRTWGPNLERGLYKTTNGGKTWKRILFVDRQSGVIEVQMDPSDPEKLLVATWQRQRQIYDDGEPDMSDGPGSAVFKTTNGGKSWTRLGAKNGLPEGNMGRYGIDYCKTKPNVVYLITGGARLPKEKNGVWRSDDGGQSWNKVNDSSPRPMYYCQIRVDPNNPDTVFVLGVGLTKSTDGAKTFQSAGRGTHPDHHCLWIDPADANHVLLGNDGGFYESTDGGASFNAIRKFAIGQFYHVAVDNRRDYRVVGGLQDNGTWYGPAIKRGKTGPVQRDFRSINGGDGFVARFDHTNPDIVYVESQNGGLRRNYFGAPDKAPTGALRRPSAPENERERWAWKTDFVVSPHDPKSFLVGGQYVYKSTEQGANLKRISPKLALTELGACTAIAISPKNADVIWAGTDDGGLWLTRDGGANWKALHGKPNLPKGWYVSTIEPSRYAEGRCYVAFDGHRANDDAPGLVMTEDFGETWASLNANLPSFGSSRCIREDTQREGLLYCGTEFFAFTSLDNGRTWLPLNGNLPTVAVHDYAISDAAGELVAATHGRSLWALEIGWLREIKPEILSTPVYLFGPHSAVLWNDPVVPADATPQVADGEFVGQNAELGAAIVYWIGAGNTLREPVKITITDVQGKEIAQLPGSGTVGFQRVVWDLKSNGQAVAPGEYWIELSAGGISKRRSLRVDPDPEGPPKK